MKILDDNITLVLPDGYFDAKQIVVFEDEKDVQKYFDKFIKLLSFEKRQNIVFSVYGQSLFELNKLMLKETHAIELIIKIAGYKRHIFFINGRHKISFSKLLGRRYNANKLQRM